MFVKEQASPWYDRLAEVLSLPDGYDVAFGCVPVSAAALTTLALAGKGSLVLAVLATPHHLDEFVSDARAFLDEPDSRLVVLPMVEAGAETDPEILGWRLSAAGRLASRDPDPCLVATCVQALLQPFPDPARTEKETLRFQQGEACDVETLFHRLLALGYLRVPEVQEKRQLALKGGLLDVWPLTASYPFRIEVAEDRVESIRQFDPGDQRSIRRREDVSLPPAAARRASLPVSRLLPPGTLVAWVDYAAVEDHAEQFCLNTCCGKERGLSDLVRELQQHAGIRQVAFGDPAPPDWIRGELPFLVLPDAVPGDLQDPDLLEQRRHLLLSGLERRMEEEGVAVHLWLDTEGMCEHLAGETGDAPFRFRVAPLSQGFEIPPLQIVLATQTDLYGRAKRPLVRRGCLSSLAVSSGERLDSLDHLSVGDLVVHVAHGIGRYQGVTEIAFDGQRREVLTIEYAEGAKLHVPITHAHLLARYLGTGGSVRLHRLGGRRWSAEKSAAQRAVQDLAATMLETQARRSHLAGHALDAETPWLQEFEASFPYAETPDQARCIAEVFRDLRSPHPMDRLICGDAGYGKTEVAMRAAFVCAMQERQVAILVPTTVLAQQHYDTFRDRMGPYPVRIAMHSRFCTPDERAAALRGIQEGAVDILIGTHGLLQPEVRFRNLGLVVIDEEQRFGVRHKEHFKTLRTLVDVLTLSATPIPRTLQLGLSGVRDLSLLQTPPQDRVATETRVIRDSDEVIRTAIAHELDRGGQVFFLYNRILTIERMRRRLEHLAPHARIALAHGQMPAARIEEVMRRFASGGVDVLLCTTIIESGVDIPRANTILVDRADRFGIADLYQLRGRVGRGPRKGHAIFLVPDSGVLDSNARERLKALRQHSGTGAGFQLALRDLGIRGAGSLLGAAQSGHIAAVGFHLYCQLLRVTVAKLKGAPPPKLIEVELQLDGLDVAPGSANATRGACLPYGYIDEEPQRIAAYRRLAECSSSSELDALAAELSDRYGPPPPEARRLFRIASLRILASEVPLQRIETRDREVRLFQEGRPLRFQGEFPRLRGRSLDAQLNELERLLRTVCVRAPAAGGARCVVRPGTGS